MSYLKFDKEELVNLEYSLQREFLRTNRLGAYSSSTISGCNTRKYHGMLIVQLDELDGGKYVLLSSIDESIIQHDTQFNLGIHKYPGEFYEPKGHKYIRNFEIETIPKVTYRVGGVILTKTRMLVENSNQVIVKYTLEEANSPTTLRFKPFLAFRNVHQLTKANMVANSKYAKVKNGIMMKLYDGFPNLYMQFSKEPDFVPVPDWSLNIEYIKERSRGYEYQEDLLVPGYFELDIKKGESIFFSASTELCDPKNLYKHYETEKESRLPRDSFVNCLLNSAQQFRSDRKDGQDLIAGFPWYESIPRQTFFALPGILLTKKEVASYEAILATNLGRLKDGLLPKYAGTPSDYDAADAPLMAFSAIQELVPFSDKKTLWKNYGSALKEILSSYKNGTHFYIHMEPNGLIYAKKDGVALTWMDAYIDGSPVTQRGGLAVEINALWYNAVCFALDLAEAAKDKKFIGEWSELPSTIAQSFLDTFWDDTHEYLADFVDGNYTDWAVRPNMLLAAACAYSPLSREQKKMILSKVRNELLTPRGLRTLAPNDLHYKGTCEGNVDQRSATLHMGSVFPFLIYPFVKTYLEVHKAGGLSLLKQIMAVFEEEMSEHCLGTLSEVYEGNPPYTARGAISQAWNVGGVLSAISALENYKI
ncbi:MAG: glycogen debranching enzyme N-terminal domain-containing protein [Bacteroidia bacterium]|nr:glycogen debranching enzyme N-terminal domain-containing protein [Bacteroidia bacterium]